VRGAGGSPTLMEIFFACVIADLIRVRIASILALRIQESTTSICDKGFLGGDEGGIVGRNCGCLNGGDGGRLSTRSHGDPGGVRGDKKGDGRWDVIEGGDGRDDEGGHGVFGGMSTGTGFAIRVGEGELLTKEGKFRIGTVRIDDDVEDGCIFAGEGERYFGSVIGGGLEEDDVVRVGGRDAVTGRGTRRDGVGAAQGSRSQFERRRE